MSDTDGSWERKIVTQLAESSLKEQRRSRRWGIFFKLLTFIYIGAIVFIFGQASLTEMSLDEKHTALVELNGVIADDKAANADAVITSLRDAFENENSAAVNDPAIINVIIHPKNTLPINFQFTDSDMFLRKSFELKSLNPSTIPTPTVAPTIQ